MTRSILLESFGESDDRRAARLAAEKRAKKTVPPEQTELYRQGFEAGQLLAEQALAAELAAASEERAGLARAIAGLHGARAETEAAIAGRAATLVRQAFTAVAPRLAARGFAEEASIRVRDWLARAASGRAVLRAAPDRAAWLLDELADAETPGCDLEIVEDTSVGANALRLEWTDGLAEIDLDQAVGEVMAALERVAPSEEDPAAIGAPQQVEDEPNV